MPIERKILERIDFLIARSVQLRRGRDPADDNPELCENRIHMGECVAWLASARNIAAIAVPNESDPYRRAIDDNLKVYNDWTSNQAVGRVGELLRVLRDDLEGGFLASVIEQAKSEVFEDFLSHGRAYLDKGQKNEAVVIAGVVFEDTTRRIAKLHAINATDTDLDSVISQLARNGVISGAMAKRARASAHVRTKATHAQWDEFTASDVQAAIAVADELILRHLSA